jgi:hypothetical protein
LRPDYIMFTVLGRTWLTELGQSQDLVDLSRQVKCIIPLLSDLNRRSQGVNGVRNLKRRKSPRHSDEYRRDLLERWKVGTFVYVKLWSPFHGIPYFYKYISAILENAYLASI